MRPSVDPISRSQLQLKGLVAPLALVLTAAGLAAIGPGCGGPKEGDYKPKPAFSGRAAALPPVPTLPNKPKKIGDAYTVTGIIHDLRSRIHAEKLLALESVTIIGYIVKTNLAEAPACAVHKSGKKDGPECDKTPPPVPTFWIGDEKTTPVGEAVQVMGWASNWAKVFDAYQKNKSPSNKESYKDETWGVTVPNPLPLKDAKVKVTGKYATSFTLASSGAESNPLTGILTYKSMEYIEPPAPPGGVLPGVKLREVNRGRPRGGAHALPRANTGDTSCARQGSTGANAHPPPSMSLSSRPHVPMSEPSGWRRSAARPRPAPLCQPQLSSSSARVQRIEPRG
jgi:hypothetical protein